MKKTYSKKHIYEALDYWRSQLRLLDESTSDAVEAAYKDGLALAREVLKSSTVDEDEDEDSTKAQVIKSIDELKERIESCQTAADVDELVDSLVSDLENAQSTMHEEEAAQAEQTVQIPASQLESMSQQIKDMAEQIKKLEKKAVLKKPLWKKLLGTLMKYGVIVSLICGSGMYLWSSMPGIARKAVSSAVDACRRDIRMLQLDVSAAKEVAKNAADSALKLSDQMEKNHKEIVEKIDQAFSTLNKLSRMIMSDEALAKKNAEAVQEMNKILAKYKQGSGIDASDADDAKAAVDKVSTGGDSKLEKMKKDAREGLDMLKLGWHSTVDVFTRSPKSGMQKESADRAEFARQRALLRESLQTWRLRIDESAENEDEKNLKELLASAFDQVLTRMRKPDDVQKWFDNNKDDIKRLLKSKDLDPDAKAKLRKALAYLSDELDYAEYDKKSFLGRNWGKILVAVMLLALFLMGGALMSVGYATRQAGGSLSSTQWVMSFFMGQWSWFWHIAVGFIGALAVMKLGKAAARIGRKILWPFS